MSDFVDMLVEMGFEAQKAKKAVESTGNRGVEAAMEWILSNPDPPSLVLTGGKAEGTAGGTDTAMDVDGAPADKPPESAEADQVAKSYKCNECGKLFQNMEAVEFHAAKTNHSDFAESTEEKKPLTPEEKAEQQKKLMELLAKKRKEREENEKKEEIEKEKKRMASGKDLLEAQRRIQDMEMKNILEQRKREKLEEKIARDRVKAQIEADKAARKAKFSGIETPEVPAVAPTPVATTPSQDSVSKKDYTETKVQLRLPSGKTLTQTFGVNEPLAAVRVFVEVNRGEGEYEGDFNMMTTFPRKVFSEEEYTMPLQALGLVPSAVIMITRKA